MVWTLPRSLSLLRRFPGPNVPIIVSRGHSDWPAMRVLKRLGGSRSDCSVFPNALPPHLVGLLLDRRSLVDLTCSLLGYTCLFGRGLFSLLPAFSPIPSIPSLFSSLALPFLLHSTQRSSRSG